MIHTITGATENQAKSKNKRRQHLRNVMTIKGSSNRPREERDWQIKFSPFDTKIVEDNGNDLIDIFLVITTFLVERIFVDDGSAVEVLIWKAFKK